MSCFLLRTHIRKDKGIGGDFSCKDDCVALLGVVHSPYLMKYIIIYELESNVH